MTTRRFGIEIEAMGMTETEVANLLNSNGIECQQLGYTHRVVEAWKVTYDSSLRGHQTFELVSPPLSGTEGIEQVKKVVELLNDAGCDVNRSCGIHVHVEVTDLDQHELANVWNRYRKFESDIDAFMPRSRRDGVYCKSLGNRDITVELNTARRSMSTIRYEGNNQSRMTDRYYKVNMQAFLKYGTIEFRQHSGSLNRSKIANWINFLLEFVEASKTIINVRTEVVQVDDTPSLNGLSGMSRRVALMIKEAPSYGITAQAIANHLGTTKASVQSVVCRLRTRHGYHISTGRRYKWLSGGGTQTVTRTTNGVVDSLWRGVSETTKTFYRRRAANLASQS